MNHSDSFRPTFWRGIFYLLLAIGIPLMVVRFTRGLGSVTNLSDQFPWGLWIGFDILCGVGLAAGGFTITAIVYIFHVKRFHSIVRPTVLTAFLGYLLVVAALLVDLGRPWNLWRPMVLWNPSSVMFEIAWCVMLYTTVLALEASGMAFERFGWTRALRIQRNLTIPLVVAGVILSTLHQSSLGALYLIIPGKLYPLWYTTALPLIFVASSICAGLAMVIVESNISSRAFGRELELPVLRDVGHILVAALGVFGVLRLTDLWYRGSLHLAFEPTHEALMFQLEFFAGVIAPFVMLALPRVRADSRGLYIAGLLTVMGFIVNRLNVAVTGLERAAGVRYIPAWSELLISVMFVAIGFAAFAWAVRHLNVFPPKAEETPRPLPFPGSG
ncbi:MAG: Ni/Fe-hydrogenase cytochrome b subunit [Acidobacteriota bacterium]|jgi:Ni/Fe-hydrogenase subunit HybB-like protein